MYHNSNIFVFFSSKSFGNDAQILKNLNDLKCQMDFKKSNGISKKLVFDGLTSFESSLENLNEENTPSRFAEPAQRTPVFENDPLGAFHEPLETTPISPSITNTVPRVQSGIELDRSGSPVLFREWSNMHRSATYSEDVGNVDKHIQRSSTMPPHCVEAEQDYQQSPIKSALGSAFKIPFS